MDFQFKIPAVAALGPALLAFALVALVRHRRDAPGWRGGPLLLRSATALYATAVLSLTFFPLWIYGGAYRNETEWIGQIQPIPLLTADITMVPNVIMFLPLGFLLPLLRPRITRGRTVLACALISLAIEVTQLLQFIAFANGRAVDINDLIANTLGGFLGYMTLRAAQRATTTRAALERVSSPAPTAS
ncbi:VanZ family protein [Streptomyces sp. OUCMDZ-4982]|uniref:VanZ family protein n=1 Tax=Streptomyces sp. OUCMDZ-4982 TaxID=2973090 RepID=UPI00215CE2D0|nr:VanZ family protein [Streptomyces sp. OUCMDZ-4982]MCR8946262.1 VanZ family protein [Streptomyces sp. OUCMDZ-4982]